MDLTRRALLALGAQSSLAALLPACRIKTPHTNVPSDTNQLCAWLRIAVDRKAPQTGAWAHVLRRRIVAIAATADEAHLSESTAVLASVGGQRHPTDGLHTERQWTNPLVAEIANYSVPTTAGSHRLPAQAQTFAPAQQITDLGAHTLLPPRLVADRLAQVRSAASALAAQSPSRIVFHLVTHHIIVDEQWWYHNGNAATVATPRTLWHCVVATHASGQPRYAVLSAGLAGSSSTAAPARDTTDALIAEALRHNSFGEPPPESAAMLLSPELQATLIAAVTRWQTARAITEATFTIGLPSAATATANSTAPFGATRTLAAPLARWLATSAPRTFAHLGIAYPGAHAQLAPGTAQLAAQLPQHFLVDTNGRRATAHQRQDTPAGPAPTENTPTTATSPTTTATTAAAATFAAGAAAHAAPTRALSPTAPTTPTLALLARQNAASQAPDRLAYVLSGGTALVTREGTCVLLPECAIAYRHGRATGHAYVAPVIKTSLDALSAHLIPTAQHVQHIIAPGLPTRAQQLSHDRSQLDARIEPLVSITAPMFWLTDHRFVARKTGP